ncbi:MAG: hypothetical protein KQH63_14345 [Desulfobulbaceae bacterium]|nr:hypothetical protein [Desulfobulbaceae bacterium]
MRFLKMMLCQRIRHMQGVLVFLVVCWGVASVHAEVSTYTMADFSSAPISLIETAVSPQVMINSSNDHQLFFKAYNDYSDLDDDDIPETTYKHSIDYYGYFDSYKCYDYDAGDQRFEPVAVTADKYCTGASSSYWSGNFLNWASMTRIDAIRKILFGGHRRVDTSTDTVLERAFIPLDIHAFAKHYDGNDINDLTPFSVNSSSPTGSSSSSVGIGTGSKNFNTNQAGNWVEVGDYVTIIDHANSGNFMKGWVTSFDSSDGNPLTVNVKTTGGSGTIADWDITNLTRTGLTICNVTYSSANDFSEEITEPPLIRVAEGNYAFWSAGEVHQCMWEEEDPGSNGKNYNDPVYSEIYAAQDNPKKADVGLGLDDYVARVQVCKDANADGVLDLVSSKEKCKQYPYGNFKPIGLLQLYGDDDKLLFGMVAGTYGKATRGGEMVQKIANIDGVDGMCREINLGRDCDGDGDVDGGTDTGFNNQDDWVDANHHIGDGTFKRVYSSAGGPIGHATKSEGVINTWSLFRIYGYDYDNWNYNSNQGDKCPLSINFFGDTSDSECHNWGNPFAEIYLSGLRYFAGENSPTDYQSGDGQFIEGINYNTGVWVDPVTTDNYCTRLNVVNFNSSVISADTVFDSDPAAVKDELDTNSFGVVKDLDSSRNSQELTEIIGRVEEVYPDAAHPDRKWFVGETDADQNRKCTAKEITDLGEVRGLCPEGPDLRGGFRVAGLAWYAHTNDIRPDTLTGNRALVGIQKVDTYSVRLAAGNPVIEIPIPGAPDDEVVTLLPSCITNDKDDYGCTMVDFKIVKPHTEVAGVGHGKFLVIWEDSLQGNDYDLDAGGIIEYSITATNITITTGVTLENLGYSIGHGYVISGTEDDGLHIHSGTNGFNYTDPTSIAGCTNCYGLVDGGSTSSRTYTLGDASAGLLEDPLWYASKWGGFEDMNDNDIPDRKEEWDSVINATGESGSDDIPDTYFYASHPQQLEDALNRVFLTILERTSSGTAAAVVSNNVRGEGALYQAYFEPLKKDLEGRQASWLGTVHALWLDSYGYTRQDCSLTDNIAGGECTPNGILDNYLYDQVIQSFYDETEERTRIRVYTSDDGDVFDPYSMEGVVSDYTAGDVTLVPYSMEGAVTAYADRVITLEPYSMTGEVTAYDPDTGEVTLAITEGTLLGPAGQAFDKWQIYDSTSLLTARSDTSLTLSDSGSLTFTVDPAGDWLVVHDDLTISTYNLVGEQGKGYDNWYIECLSAAAESTVVHDITLVNTGEVVITVEDDVFTGCTSAKIATFNMTGYAGDTYSSWSVVNKTTGNGGSSATVLTLANSGSLAFTVTPVLDWIEEGDRLMLSNFDFIEKELYELGYLWNAREQLYLEGLSDAQIESNRLYSAQADTGRHIMTWIDKDLDSTVDTGEYVEFEETMFAGASPVSYGFFDVDNQTDAENLVNYVRGVDVAGYRSRTVKYTSDDATARVMRLGDIINSTPTVISSPQEAFNILYDDSTYTAYRQQYADRRVVAYVGGNDGLLHAFNAGFYELVRVDAANNILAPGDAGYDTAEQKVRYSVSGKNCATDGAATEHPLGSEIWAYAPMNLLPHLKWLKDPNYSHVYYVDGKPRVFDANIFTVDANHPNGWGTVMVVSMRFGGGEMVIDTAADGLGTIHPPGNPDANDVAMRSAYVIFDITNPEEEPTLLGEIQPPDGSLTMVYPTVMAFRDSTIPSNKWYLVFGSGPESISTAASGSTAKMYVLDLEELTTPGTTTNAPTGCALTALGASGMRVITCDTGVADTFMGSPVSVDWDLDFNADTLYFGLVGDADADVGRLMRCNLDENRDPAQWDAPTTLVDVGQPVVSQPALSVDNFNNKWVYFGTGRYYVMDDKSSTTIQSLYGVKDDDSGGSINVATQLIDSTDIDVYTDDAQTVVNGPNATIGGAQITNFKDLVTEVDDYKMGWYLDLPAIVGTTGIAPATRSLGQSALLGGILFTSVFQPSDDPCAGEGNSRLYGQYYKTGTSYPSPTIFGTEAVTIDGEVKYKATRYVDLGRGLATSPAIHSGSGGGGDDGSGDGGEDGATVSVFTQMSTGDVFRQTADTATAVRSGKTSWKEK